MTRPPAHVGQTATPEESRQPQQDGQPQPRGHRQQHLVDAEDDPASDANTDSANHPKDDE